MDSASPVAPSVAGRTTPAKTDVALLPAGLRSGATAEFEVGPNAAAPNAASEWQKPHRPGIRSEPGRSRVPDRRRYRRAGRPRPAGEGTAQ